MGIAYATREQVTSALEHMETAHNGPLIDGLLLSSSRGIDRLTHRRFYPERRTVRLDWPNYSYAPTWEIDLGVNEMISAETITSGGTVITDEIILRRYDGIDEPPYSLLQIDLSSSAAFAAGTTWQQANVLTGLFGDKDTETTLARGQLSADINASVTTISVEPSTATGLLDIGTGSLLLVGTERMQVVQRIMADSGATISANVLDTHEATTITSASASSFVVGETILIDSERFRINDIAGTSITVARAFDGSTLAVHSSGASIYAFRSLAVIRGVLGSTAASHTDGDAIYVHQFPPLVNQLCIAETMMGLQQYAAAYGRTIGSGNFIKEFTGAGLMDLRNMVIQAHGRISRKAAI
jgi:hypothetical protein